jgi:hypothetical protein
MKETKKAIPFLVAACMVFALFYFNPDKEAHIDKIKAEYIKSNPMTWRATWLIYERSLEHQNYLFFSVVKRKHQHRSLGIAGMVVTLEGKQSRKK